MQRYFYQTIADDWTVAHTLPAKLELICKYLAVATAFVIPLSTSLTNTLFVLVPVLFLGAGNLRIKIRLTFQQPLAWVFLLFFMLFIFGLIYTSAPLSTALERLAKYDKFFWGIFFIPLFIEERWRRYALNAFICAVAIMLLTSFLKALGFIHYEIANGGPVEVFKGHIEFSFLLAFGAYLVLQKIMLLQLSHVSSCHPTVRPKGSRNKKFFSLLALSLLFVLILYNLFFLTMGRSGYFIFAGLLLLFCLQHMRAKGILIAVFLLTIFATLLLNFSPMFNKRIHAVITEAQSYSYAEQNTGVDTSIGLRLEFWKNSLRLMHAHFWLGIGTGSFAHEYANLQPQPQVLVDNPHNEYLNVAVQLGVVGLILLLLMFAWQLWYSRLLPLEMRHIAQAVVCAIMLGSLGNSWLMDTTEGHFYVLFMTLCFAARVKY